MAENPGYNWKAWNEISVVQEHLKELHNLMHVIWRDAKEHEELQTSISGLMTFTHMIIDRVDDIDEMVGPGAKPQDVKAA